MTKPNLFSSETGSRCPYGRCPDCPRSQPPLTADDNLNPECAQERLCPAQPASECPGGSLASQNG